MPSRDTEKAQPVLNICGMIEEPAPGPQVAVADHRRQALDKVLHEPRAVGRGVTTAGAKQQQGKAILLES